MRAMILAAGLGTRLRPITDAMPKPMVPIVGVPNIIRTIMHLKSCGIRQFVINLHHLPDVLEGALKNGSGLGVEIAYSRERDLLGTGGGIKHARSLLGNETFVVVNGDILFAPEIQRVIDAHKKSRAMATLMVRPDPRAETFGAVGLDPTGRIRRLVWAGDTASRLRMTMFTGVHVLEPEISEYLPDEGCIVRKTYIPLLEKGMPLHGVTDHGFWHDLGTQERYLEANCALVTGSSTLTGFVPPKNGVFVGRDVIMGKNCRLAAGAIIGDRAQLAPDITVERAVVFPGAKVSCDVIGAVVTGDGAILTPRPGE